MPESTQLPADLLKKFSAEKPLVCLMRHGRILDSGVKRFIGQTDLPLNAMGRNQAKAWQKIFAQIQFEKIYVSGLLRTRQTAELCCPGQPVTADPRLNEIDLGDWENLSFDQVKARFPDDFEQRGRNIYHFRTPGGESFKDLKERVVSFFDSLFSTAIPESGPTLVVAHSGVIRVMACLWAGKSFEELLKLSPRYGQSFVFTLGDIKNL